MLCQSCGNAEAVIELTTVRDDEKRVQHLCEACASEHGVEVEGSGPSAPLVDFLAQIGKSMGEEMVPASRCPSCGLTPAQLKQLGRLGCAECYTHFEQHLRNLLRRLHGGTHHVGKQPTAGDTSGFDRKARVQSLRRSLQRAVAEEDFEQAALLRDQIRRLETVQET